jgi:hypothetical protein
LQTDLMGYQYGMNWYGYVGADPVNFVDPSGMIVEPNPDPVPPPIIVVGPRKVASPCETGEVYVNGHCYGELTSILRTPIFIECHVRAPMACPPGTIIVPKPTPAIVPETPAQAKKRNCKSAENIMVAGATMANVGGLAAKVPGPIGIAGRGVAAAGLAAGSAGGAKYYANGCFK